MIIDMGKIIDVKPDDRLIVLRGKGEFKTEDKFKKINDAVKNLIHAVQLDKKEWKIFLKSYYAWIVQQPEKIMWWEAQELLPSGHYVYSYEKEKRILRSRGCNDSLEDEIIECEKQLEESKKFLALKGMDFEKCKEAYLNAEKIKCENAIKNI